MSCVRVQSVLDISQDGSRMPWTSTGVLRTLTGSSVLYSFQLRWHMRHVQGTSDQDLLCSVPSYSAVRVEVLWPMDPGTVKQWRDRSGGQPCCHCLLKLSKIQSWKRSTETMNVSLVPLSHAVIASALGAKSSLCLLRAIHCEGERLSCNR